MERRLALPFNRSGSDTASLKGNVSRCLHCYRASIRGSPTFLRPWPFVLVESSGCPALTFSVTFHFRRQLVASPRGLLPSREHASSPRQEIRTSMRRHRIYFDSCRRRRTEIGPLPILNFLFLKSTRLISCKPNKKEIRPARVQHKLRKRSLQPNKKQLRRNKKNIAYFKKCGSSDLGT